MAKKLTLTELNTLGEMELRTGTIEWPKTTEEMLLIINAVTDRQHDYGTCAAAMSIAALAAFYYVSSKLGVTGFQASCADLDFIRRTRGYEGPFMILEALKMVYPQYDLREDVDEFINESMPAIRAKAQVNLEEDPEFVSPRVLQHWKDLVAQKD